MLVPDRFYGGYYWSHALLCMSYLWTRTRHDPSKSQFRRLSSVDELGNYEFQILICIGLIIVLRTLKRRSLDESIATVNYWARCVVITLVFFIDLRLFAWYLLAFGLAWLIFPQPREPFSQHVARCSPLAISEDIATSSATWAVLCHTPWSDECTHFVPTWNKLAAQHSSDSVRFAQLDVAHWPRAGKDLKIDTTLISKQLPTVLVIRDAKQQGRLPSAAVADSFFKRAHIGHRDVVRLLDMVQAKGDAAPPPVSSANKTTPKKLR